MKKNMSQADRILRILSFVLSVALFATGTVGMAIGIILISVTLVLAITSFAGYCLVYGFLGISSRKKKIAG